MTGYAVSTYALQSAADTWDDQSESLRGARKRLLDAEAAVAALGPRVGPAAALYIDTWINTVKSLAGEAQRHADALEGAASSYATVETYVEEDLARMLPWAQRKGTYGAQGYP